MSTPKRQQIREAIKTMLLNNTDAGANVYSNRVSAFWKSELPSISIFMRDEALTPREMAKKNYIRKSNVLIEIHAEANEGLDDTLDEINEQVEAILLADTGLMNTVQGLVFTDLEFEVANDASTNIGVLTLTLQITYTK
jgi:hypothetical protein